MSLWQLSDSPAEPAASKTIGRPTLRGLPGSKGLRPGLGFVLLLIGVLAAGLVGVLALNTYIQNTQMELNAAQRQAATLALQASDKQGRLYAVAAPGSLAEAASKLGMVPMGNPAYIDLRTGKIVGATKGASAPAASSATASAAASPSPSPAPASAKPTTKATKTTSTATPKPATGTTTIKKP